MDAIRLLRVRRNYSFTEAKRFVDEISGSAREPG